MQPDINAVLDSTPDSPTRSKLEPYHELIRGLRQKRKTFAEIAHILLLNYNVRIHRSNIHRFIKVRSKQRQLQFELPPPQALSPTPPTPHNNPPLVVNTEIHAHIQAQSPPPQASTPGRQRKKFPYDPSKGLTLPDEYLYPQLKKDE